MNEEQELIITQGSENIFEDLGFEKSEAANLKIRADLILALKEYIQQNDWTQEQAAEFFEETQPRISNLMNGEISRFSVDKLINMLARAGMEVKVEVSVDHKLLHIDERMRVSAPPFEHSDGDRFQISSACDLAPREALRAPRSGSLRDRRQIPTS